MRHFEIKKCEKKQWIVLFQSISFTPWKINMEPPNHPFQRKRIFQTSMIMFHVNLQGCNHQCFDFGYQEKQPVFIPNGDSVSVTCQKTAILSGQMKTRRKPAGWEFPPNGGDFFGNPPKNAPKEFRLNGIIGPICPDIYYLFCGWLIVEAHSFQMTSRTFSK